MLSRALIFLSASLATLAIAQAPEAPPPVAAAVSARPAHGCVRPERPGRLASANQVKTFNADVIIYMDCMKAFVKAQGELVKLHTESGNNAVVEYNEFVTLMSKKPDESEKKSR